MKKVLSILLVLFFAASLAADGESKVSFTPDMRLIFQYNFDLNNTTHHYNLERAYLGLSAKLDNVTFRTTLDLTYSSDNVKAMYLKYAYAEINKLIPIGKYIFGQQKTGLIDFEDKIWGHRSVAKVPVDLYKLDTSADMGLALDMKLPNKLGGIHFGYFAGEGYKGDTEEEDQEKALSLRANFNLTPCLMMTAYGKYGFKRAADAENDVLFGGILSFKNKLVSVAAEFFSRTTRADVGQRLIAAYATFHAIEKKLDIFARFDMWDPNTDVDDETDEGNHLYLGLKYFLASKTSVAAFFRSVMPSVGDNANSINFSFDQKF
jgi:hypothetical protein